MTRRAEVHHASRATVNGIVKRATHRCAMQNDCQGEKIDSQNTIAKRLIHNQRSKIEQSDAKCLFS